MNTSGTVVERYVYDPYGKVSVYDASWNLLSGSQVAMAYGFQGLRQDAGLGLGLDDMRGRVWLVGLQRPAQRPPPSTHC